MAKKWAGNAEEGSQGFHRTTPKAVSPAQTIEAKSLQVSVSTPSAAQQATVTPPTSKDLRQEYLAYRRRLQEEENLTRQLKKMKETQPNPLLTGIRMFQTLIATKNPVAVYELYKQHKQASQRIQQVGEELNRRKQARENLCSDCHGSGVSPQEPNKMQCPTCGRVNSVYVARTLQPNPASGKKTSPAQRKQPESQTSSSKEPSQK